MSLSDLEYVTIKCTSIKANDIPIKIINARARFITPNFGKDTNLKNKLSSFIKHLRDLSL